MTIANTATGNPTQITVYADGGGSTIHDVAPDYSSFIESAVSTVLEVAAVVTGQAYLYLAAAAIDAAESVQAFANGQDLAGFISLAEAVSAGITGGAGGASPLGATPVIAAPVTAQIINIAAEGVGGVYGVVKSAENGNGVGILAGALEAAAAAAAGIGMNSSGSAQQTLNLISTALGAAGVATNVGSDFASGNLAQGLLDSLNLYLPAEALANAATQSAAQGNLPPNDLGTGATATPVPAGGLASPGNLNSTGSSNAVVTESGVTYLFAVTSEPVNDGTTVTLDTIANALWNVALKAISFLTSETAQLLDLTAPASTNARQMNAAQAQFLDNNGNPILNPQGEPMMKPASADPAAVTDIGAALTSFGSPDDVGAGGVLGAANLALFRQGGAWDFQRVGPDGTFVGAFTDFANVEIGAYAASIGMSLSDVLGISNQYAAVNSNFSDYDPTYTHLRSTNVSDITLGYNLYQNGLVGHH